MSWPQESCHKISKLPHNCRIRITRTRWVLHRTYFLTGCVVRSPVCRTLIMHAQHYSRRDFLSASDAILFFLQERTAFSSRTTWTRRCIFHGQQIPLTEINFNHTPQFIFSPQYVLFAITKKIFHRSHS